MRYHLCGMQTPRSEPDWKKKVLKGIVIIVIVLCFSAYSGIRIIQIGVEIHVIANDMPILCERSCFDRILQQVPIQCILLCQRLGFVPLHLFLLSLD